MKNIIRASLFCAGLYFMPPAHAGGDYLQGWGMAPQTSAYVGGSIGAANLSDFEDGTAGAGKLFAGVRHRSIGAELGYTKFGQVEGEGKQGRLDALLDSEIDGIYAAAMGYVPVYANTELFGKAGVMYWDSENRQSVPQIDEHSTSDDSGLSPLLGVGAQYQLNQNMHVRGEWEHVFATGSDQRETDADMLSIGVSLSTY